MENLKDLICSELAKKELNFNEIEDKNNQPRLAALVVKTEELKIQVSDITKKMIAKIRQSNPDLDTAELELVVLSSISKKVESGEIKTVTDIGSYEITRQIGTEVDAAKQTNPKLVRGDNNYKPGTSIEETDTAIIAALSLKGMIDAYDQLYNGNNPEAREKAGNSISLSNAMDLNKDYRKNNIGTKADRATFLQYARVMASGDQILMQKAVAEAKKFGYANLLNGNGTFNVEALHQALKKSLEGLPQEQQERFSTIDKMFEEVRAANKRAGQKKALEMSKDKEFAEKLKAAKTPEEKEELVKNKIKEERIKKVLKVIMSVAKSEHVVPVTKYMEELYAIDSNMAKAILEQAAERLEKPSRKEEIESFLLGKTKQEEISPIHEAPKTGGKTFRAEGEWSTR